MPVSMQCPTASELSYRVQGTLWEPGRLTALPCAMGAPELVSSMQAQLSDFPTREQVWHRCSAALACCELSLLQGFAAFQLTRGFEWQSLPPAAIGARQRAQICAGVSGQRFSSESPKGLDHILPPGLGKELHILYSAELPSPFLPRAWPDGDVEFVAHTIGVWRELLPLLANRQRKIFRSVVKALAPLHLELARFRCSSACRVAVNKNAAVIAFATALLRWPDVWQAKEMIQGFSIVGEVPVSGLFRSITPHVSKDPDTAAWLASDAVAAVGRRRRSPRCLPRAPSSRGSSLLLHSGCLRGWSRLALHYFVGAGLWVGVCSRQLQSISAAGCGNRASLLIQHGGGLL